jgi:hypothetical protein
MSEVKIAALLFTALIGVVGFLFSMWMRRIEENLATLAKAYTEQRVKEAEVTGQSKMTQDTIAKLHKDIGVLANSVQRMWDIMLVKGLADTRPSDKILGNGPR